MPPSGVQKEAPEISKFYRSHRCRYTAKAERLRRNRIRPSSGLNMGNCPMDKGHQLMGGDIQLFRRPNSKFWYCQATVGGRQRRLSTKKESLRLAEDVSKDWFLTLQGKARAAKKFMAEYESITKGERSLKWVVGHEARLRLHLLPFFGATKLSKITPGMIPDYRVHQINVGTSPRLVTWVWHLLRSLFHNPD